MHMDDSAALEIVREFKQQLLRNRKYYEDSQPKELSVITARMSYGVTETQIEEELYTVERIARD